MPSLSTKDTADFIQTLSHVTSTDRGPEVDKLEYFKSATHGQGGTCPSVSKPSLFTTSKQRPWSVPFYDS